LKKGPITIRDARVEELDKISLLLKDAYLQYRELLPSEAWNYYVTDIMNVSGRMEESQLIVAEVDGHLAGAITLYLDGASPGEQGWPEGWARLRLLAVHPRYRGRGIGRALMEECLRRCVRKGIRTVGLHTTEMMDLARRMYERMGFVRAPQYDFHPRPGVLVVAYKLDLGPADG